MRNHRRSAITLTLAMLGLFLLAHFSQAATITVFVFKKDGTPVPATDTCKIEFWDNLGNQLTGPAVTFTYDKATQKIVVTTDPTHAQFAHTDKSVTIVIHRGKKSVVLPHLSAVNARPYPIYVVAD